MALTTNWTIDDLLRQTSTREALGQPPLSRDAIANTMYASNLAEREDAFNRSREVNRFNEQVREFNITEQNKQEALDLQTSNQKNALIGQAVGGVGQMAMMAPMAYKMGKELWGSGATTPTSPTGTTAADIAYYESQGITKGPSIIENTPESMYSGIEKTSFGSTEALSGIEYSGKFGVTEGMAIGGEEYAAQAATTGTSALSGLTSAGVGIGTKLLTDYAMKEIGVGGRNERSYASNIAGGVAAGAMSFGPIGAIVGGVIGGVLSVVENESVICTELYKQGYIDKDLYLTESTYGQLLPEEVLSGYHKWAKPVVKKMKESKRLTNFIYNISKPVLQEMAHRVDRKYKRSVIGCIILYIGEPICYFIGSQREVVEVF